MDLAKNSFGGGALRSPAGQNFVAAAYKTFLSGLRGKTAGMARRRRFFLENSQFQAIFKQFLVFPRW